MDIAFIEDKTIEIEIKDQLKEAFDTFHYNILESSPSTASKHLMIVNEVVLTLDEYHHDRFHSTLDSLLYITKSERTDVDTTVALLYK